MGRKIADGPEARYARVKIEYTKDKPKISFSYPRKNGRTGSMYNVIHEYWMIILLIFVILALLYAIINIIFFSTKEIIINLNGLNQYDNYEIHNFTLCAINHSTETISNFTDVYKNICAPDGIKIDLSYILKILLSIISIVSIIILPPKIIYYPFRDKWDKLFPAYAAWKAEKKIAIFNPADVITNINTKDKDHLYFIELPVFENVICDFKCKGEFSDYLNEVEIREHKFKYYNAIPKSENRKKASHETNELLWYARFYFHKKPLSGAITIIFK